MIDFFRHLFDTHGFTPRWTCGDWTNSLGWLHILSDLGVWSAYLAIPCVLGWFVIRRSDLPFRTVFWLFGAFILACGTTHLMDALMFWWPAYRFSGLIMLFTAVVSWATVIALVPVIPQALRLRSPEALEKEIVEREKAEQALLATQDQLERRVADRTADLAAANGALQQEVAERKRAQEQTELANRLKDEFLANLSHELRTPLTAIVGWAQILRSGPQSSEELDQGLQVIERNAGLQTRIVEDVLDVSRIVSGKLRLDVQAVNLAEAIEMALAAIAPAAEARSIEIRSVLDPQAGPISGDPARLQQVVWNLLSNAVKFTPKGGKVQVRLQRVNSHVEINVSDTGQGIAAEFLPYVFERFRQFDSSTTRQHGGLGLGLSIVKQLVELHGGTVCVQSAGVGQGAAFTVQLPLPVLHPTVAGETWPPASDNWRDEFEPLAADLAGVRLLVVDDEPDARALVARVLGKCKAQVQVAGSVDEAQSILKNYRPQVLISDIGMPGQDGYELIRSVRLQFTARELPAIALTAFARTEDRRRALQAGFQMHVAKPVDARELVASVASLARLGSFDGPEVTEGQPIA